MDPLSVIASVAGTIGAVSQTIKVVAPYAAAHKKAPEIVSQVHSEALATRTILASLQQLINNFVVSEKTSTTQSSSQDPTYASLLPVDHIIAIFTDGVFLFSEFDSLLQSLPSLETQGPGNRWWTSVQWVRKRESLSVLLSRLVAFKQSVDCILSVFTSDSQGRAEHNLRRLASQVTTLLQENQALRRLLTTTTSSFSSRCSLDIPSFGTSLLDLAEKSSSSCSQASIVLGAESMLIFEKDLKQSRVYRRAKRVSLDVSVSSSVDRSHAWSIFTGLSLGKISNISVLALPIYASDIANAHHYNFNPTTPPYSHGMENNISAVSEPHRASSDVLPDNECLAIQVQLPKLKIYPYAEHLAEAKQQQQPGAIADTFSVLIEMFRCGTPLLALLACGAGRVHKLPVTDVDLQPKEIGWDGWGALAEVVDACTRSLKISQAPFVLSELMDPAVHHQNQVLKFVRAVMVAIQCRGASEMSLLESPRLDTIRKFISEEKSYLSQLTEFREASRPGSLIYFDLSADLEVSSTAQGLRRQLMHVIDAHRRLLLGVEAQIQVPPEDQEWGKVFGHWAIRSRHRYSHAIEQNNGRLTEQMVARVMKYSEFVAGLHKGGLGRRLDLAKESVKAVQSATEIAMLRGQVNRQFFHF